MWRDFQSYLKPAILVFALFCLAVLVPVFFILGGSGTKSGQQGYRGTGMEKVDSVQRLIADAPLHAAPAIHAPARVRPNGPIAGNVYKNIQVLGEQPLGEFGRTMTAMTEWVSPKEGCAYCHVEGAFESDAKYTKVVARRMIQMVRTLNNDWKVHTGAAGVTCYTCHRGNVLPAERWFRPEPPKQQGAFKPSPVDPKALRSTGLSVLPGEPLLEFLLSPTNSPSIRVAGNTALRADVRAPVQQAEKTYGLMLHITKSLGVNCTFCHNTRAFASWPESPPTRSTAWYGIRMVRDVNTQFLEPLNAVFPAPSPERIGPLGDVAKVSCATCHQGVNKPLMGASMAKFYPALLVPYVSPSVAAAAAAASAASAAAAEAAASAASPAPAASGVELMAQALPVTPPPPAAAPVLASATAVAPVPAPAPAPAMPVLAAAPAAQATPATPASPAATELVDCISLSATAARSAARMPAATSRQVIGSGRLPFYSAPDKRCEMPGVFVQPGEALGVLLEANGYALARYLRADQSVDIKAWVRSERLAPTAVAAAAVPLPPPAAAGSVCQQADAKAAQGQKAVPADTAAQIVVGTGRLQFLSSPEASCRQAGVFILAGEAVGAEVRFGEYTKVRYRNPRTGNEARGWVLSDRLAAARGNPP